MPSPTVITVLNGGRPAIRVAPGEKKHLWLADADPRQSSSALAVSPGLYKDTYAEPRTAAGVVPPLERFVRRRASFTKRISTL